MCLFTSVCLSSRSKAYILINYEQFINMFPRIIRVYKDKQVFKEFLGILRNFGACAKEFQNVVVRALTRTPLLNPMHIKIADRN